MKYVFWFAAALIVYAYAGYVAWLWLRARLRRRPVERRSFSPDITVAMVVRNEEENLPKKIENFRSLEYPSERIDFVIVSDGSTDGTDQILQNIRDPRFHTIVLAGRSGKASGLNHALRAARGEVVVFTDARQMIEANALRLLMENFADPAVGCASGELMLGDPISGESVHGVGLYWRMEKTIRELESAAGSAVGATGALYAARRELLPELPPDTILDDVYLPLCIARQGKRIVFDGRAHAWDRANLGEKREFARKVRTLSGNYQLLQLAPWLLSRENPIRFEFVSHKLLRLFVPFALATTLVTSLLIHEPVYTAAALLQLLFYGISILGFAHLGRGPLTRVADVAFTFVVLNTAALVAFKNFVTRRRVAWS